MNKIFNKKFIPKPKPKKKKKKGTKRDIVAVISP